MDNAIAVGEACGLCVVRDDGAVNAGEGDVELPSEARRGPLPPTRSVLSDFIFNADSTYPLSEHLYAFPGLAGVGGAKCGGSYAIT